MPDHTLTSGRAATPRLPRLTMFLLKIRFHGSRGEALLGDLLEEFSMFATAGGRERDARAWLRRQALLSMAAPLPRRSISLLSALADSGGGAHRDRGAAGGGSRKGGSGGFLDDLPQDVRVAARNLMRRPLFGAAAVLTLALGIGANTLIFSLFHGVALQPLPYPDPDELVGAYRIEERITGLNPTPARLSGLYAVPYALFLDWQELGESVFEEVGAYAPTTRTLTGTDRPERIRGVSVTSGVFTALQARAVLGRVFTAEDDELGAPAQIVLSHRMWQNRFGGDPGVLGRLITLGGITYTTVGVLPEDFYFPSGSEEYWITFPDERKASDYRPGGYLQVIARLRDGISLEAAQAEMDGVARHLGELHAAEQEHGVGLFSRMELVVGDISLGLIIMLVAVGLVLLVACANITGLLLVRSMERGHETAVRAALGAGRLRLIRQTMTESLVLALIGGALGVTIAFVGLRPLLTAIPATLPRSSEIVVNQSVLLFAAAVALSVGIVIGILPALRTVRVPLMEAMGRSGRGATAERRRNITQGILVVSQIGIAFGLLSATGLMARSYSNMVATDLGFDPENLVVTRIQLAESYDDPGLRLNLYRDLEERLRALPGVENVGLSPQSPFMPGTSFPPITVETSEGLKEVGEHRTTASLSYFETMGMLLLAGRGFTETDTYEAPAVIVVNKAMAERYWPDEDAVGRRIRFGPAEDPTWMTVIGVVGDIVYYMGSRPFREYYLPIAQYVDTYQNVHIRTPLDAAQLAEPIRQVVWGIDPDIPVTVENMEDRIHADSSARGARFSVSLFGALALLASLLASLGVYGTLAFSVTQRFREIGIRMALGASRENVLVRVLGRAMLLTLVGLALGTGLAIVANPGLRAALYGVEPLDPVALVQAAIVLFLTAAVAGLLPARRAVMVNPVEALRQE